MKLKILLSIFELPTYLTLSTNGLGRLGTYVVEISY